MGRSKKQHVLAYHTKSHALIRKSILPIHIR